MNQRHYKADRPGWTAGLGLTHVIFSDLRALFGPRLGDQWPCTDELTGLMSAGSKTVSGHDIVFAQQAGKMTAVQYEQHIWSSGQIPTRVGEWHDLFNALIWSLLPNSKARLNALHIEAIGQNPAGQRDRLRDALTLIDECGIIIASTDFTARRANLEHDWMGLFAHARDRWFVDRQPLLFGHGLYEQCLHPYLGLTGKAIHIRVEAEFFNYSLARQYRHVDGLLEQQLQHAGMTLQPRDLLAFPLLGVPGWHKDNGHVRFYRQTDYFRLRRP